VLLFDTFGEMMTCLHPLREACQPCWQPFPTLAGATDVPFITYLWLWPLIVFAIGVIIALVLRSTNPAKFAGIGRYMHEDIAAS